MSFPGARYHNADLLGPGFSNQNHSHRRAVCAGRRDRRDRALVAERLTLSLGRAVVVDNKPGAAGMIGADLVAKAQPDGYTVLIARRVKSPSIKGCTPKMAYSPEADLAPLTLLANAPLVLVVSPDVAAVSVKELVNLARKSPGQLSFASAGAGNVPHLAGESLKYLAAIDVIHVPYKGGTAVATCSRGGRANLEAWSTYHEVALECERSRRTYGLRVMIRQHERTAKQAAPVRARHGGYPRRNEQACSAFRSTDHAR